MIFDNFKFFYELIITHYNKFSKKNELEKFTALAANSLALLQKEKAPFGVFVIDEFRMGHGCEATVLQGENCAECIAKKNHEFRLVLDSRLHYRP